MQASIDYLKKDLNKLKEKYGKKLQEYSDRYRNPNYVTYSHVWTRINNQHEIYKDVYRMIDEIIRRLG